jgi:hypothetical protein
MCLANEGRVIADMTFSNRAEVEDLKHAMSTAFASAEEIAADSMDQMTYRVLVELHAAIIFHLIETVATAAAAAHVRIRRTDAELADRAPALLRRRPR